MRYCWFLLLVACAKPNEYVAPPPPKVTVAPPARRDVTDYVEFTGTTAATEVVEVRARVKGFLKEIKYKPVGIVEQGAVLFQIDPAEYEANLAAAEADLSSAEADATAAATAIRAAEASLTLAETAVKKLERAYEQRAVSEILVLETKAKRDVARADLEKARAQLDVAKARTGVAASRVQRAQLDLEWTTIRAPLTGRAAMWTHQVGSLVGAGDPTLLTTMINDRKIWCYFDVAERWLLGVRDAMGDRMGRTATVEDVTVEMALVTDEGYPHKGRGDYVEPAVDRETGTLRVRAIFDNKERLIPPGAFARVRVPVAQRKGALLVTERAVGVDQVGTFLLAVDAQNVVVRKDVKLGARHGGDVVVLEGLEGTEQIIVAGLQRARPGATVAPQQAPK